MEGVGDCGGRHCEIWVSEKGTAFIEDLSTNGTFVNGARIGKRTILQSGSTITIVKVINRKFGAKGQK